MPNTISRRIIGRVKVKKSKRAKSYERRFPISSAGKKITRFKL
jgi:hypothetical protein